MANHDESHDDRRVHQRLSVPHVLVKISTPERMRVAYLKDLSRGGLFIKTDRPLALERLVDVDLLPPGRATPIRVRCKVVRVLNDEKAKLAKNQGMGLQFIDVDPEMMTALDLVLAEYQSKPVPAVPPTAPDETTVQLKLAIEEIAALTSALADREHELADARKRRAEVEARVMSEGGSSNELQLELETARAENTELQMKLSEALGDAEAYRHELQVMEDDDANQRRLADSLAQQKQDLEAAHADRIAELEQQLTDLGIAHAERIAELEQQLEAEQSRRLDSERHESDLAGTKVQLTERVTEIEALLAAASEQMAAAVETTTQLETARARIAVLERAAKKPAPAPAPVAVPVHLPVADTGSDQFLKRLRANEPLVRLSRFNSFTPSDPRESAVLGLLEGCDRYSDLVVLARTMATPVQLEKMLVGFHQLTLIGFERN